MNDTSQEDTDRRREETSTNSRRGFLGAMGIGSTAFWPSFNHEEDNPTSRYNRGPGHGHLVTTTTVGRMARRAI
jgi:hypothetical protein